MFSRVLDETDDVSVFSPNMTYESNTVIISL